MSLIQVTVPRRNKADNYTNTIVSYTHEPSFGHFEIERDLNPGVIVTIGTITLTGNQAIPKNSDTSFTAAISGNAGDAKYAWTVTSGTAGDLQLTDADKKEVTIGDLNGTTGPRSYTLTCTVTSATAFTSSKTATRTLTIT